MRSPALTLAWEIGHRHRWGFGLMAVTLLACALSVPLLAEALRTSELLGTLCFVPLGLSVLGVFAAFSYTETGRGATAGFPSRLFTLPVRTRLLVSCPVVCGVAAVALVYVAWAVLVLRPAGVEVGLAWPVAFLATGMVCFQATVWSLASYRLTRLIVLSVVGMLLITAAIMSFLPEAPHHFPWLPDVVLPAGLPLAAAAAYTAALVSVARQRRGGGRRAGWWRRVLETATDVLPRRDRPFASAQGAQLWLEWRRGGVVLPFCVAAVLLGMIGPVLLLAGGSPGVTLYAVCWSLLLPVILAGAVGQGFGGPDFWSRDVSLPPFLAVRPASCGDLVAARLKVAALSALAAWAVVLVFLPLLLSLGCDTSLLAEVGRMLAATYPPVRLAAIVVLALVTAVLLTWRLLIAGLAAGLSGRRWVFLLPLGVGLVCWVAFLVGVGWMLSAEGAAGDVASWARWVSERSTAIGWALGAALAAKLSVAVVSWRAATRRELVLAGAWVYLALWSAATACLVVLVSLLLSPAEGLKLPGAVPVLACLLFVPLARPGLAPLALAWNRHR
jgi:hypothetical protein